MSCVIDHLPFIQTSVFSSYRAVLEKGFQPLYYTLVEEHTILPRLSHKSGFSRLWRRRESLFLAYIHLDDLMYFEYSYFYLTVLKSFVPTKLH